MSYVSSRKSPCHPSVTQCHLRPPAQSHLGDRVQEWHTSPTATHKATVDSFTMPVPGPHGSLAQTCYTHEAKVVATQPHCVQASPQSVPYVHTTTGALPFMAALACVRTQAPYCYLAVSPCLQGQLSHMFVPGLLLGTCPGLILAFNAVHAARPPSFIPALLHPRA